MNTAWINGVVRFLAILMFLILSGCGGGAGGSGGAQTGTADKVVATITMVDGNNQTATVGTELTNALVALIKNSSGQPIAGQIVNFVVTAGGGSVFAGAALSDANGMVRERWTLGTGAGVQKVEVRAVDSSGTAVVFATFTATAAASAPQAINIISGNNQSATQLQSLQLPLVAVVSDSHGNPVPGVSVTFAASNGGFASLGSVTTDVTGAATTSWTLGQAIGGQTLSATAAGLAPVIFSATATRAPASAAKTITKVSGDGQMVVQHLLLSMPLVVTIADALGNPVPNTPVTFSAVTSGSSYNNPSIVNTDSAGKASWQGYFHAAGQQSVEVSATGVSTAIFNTTVAASSHLYDGKYSCNNTGAINSQFNLFINNGLTSLFDLTYAMGTIVEASGKVNLSLHYNTLEQEVLSGQVLTNPFSQAIGSGSYYINYVNRVIGEVDGTWTCTRL